jgi:hypothetical protein
MLSVRSQRGSVASRVAMLLLLMVDGGGGRCGGGGGGGGLVVVVDLRLPSVERDVIASYVAVVKKASADNREAMPDTRAEHNRPFPVRL